MNQIHIAFCIGVLSLCAFSTLPESSFWWLGNAALACLVCLLMRMGISYAKYVLTGLLGLSWAIVYASWQMHMQLPHALEQQKIRVTGVVSGLPQTKHFGQRFVFTIATWPEEIRARYPHLPKRVLLNWQQTPAPEILPGQRWRFTIKLKRPHGIASPGSFDYEKSLLSQKIHALGYVTREPQQLLKHHVYGYAYWRYHVVVHLQKLLRDIPYGGMILALIAGERTGMTSQDYQILTATGTSHLMAISGLHVGLIAGLFYHIASRLWRFWPRLCLVYPAQSVAAASAMLIAFMYAAIAGFSPPTIRALIMILCAMGGLLLRRSSTIYDRLLFAFTLMLILDPLAILSVSFWLSFIAVSAVLYVSLYRYHHKVTEILFLQWRVTLALLPVTLLFFDKASSVAAISNMFAIPWISFIVLPLAFLGFLFSWISVTLGQWLMQLAAMNFTGCWFLLDKMASWSSSIFYFPVQSPMYFILSLVATLILLMPKGCPGKWASLVWFLPVIAQTPEPLSLGTVKITTLDVGQGLAMVVQTQNHSLVFDAGPKWPEAFDAGEAVVNPFLIRQHIKDIDKVIISHPDLDHIGGLNSVLAAHHVKTLLTSQVNPALVHNDQRPCLAGESWQWDGVRFSLLSPVADNLGTRNNRSCVLQIDNGSMRALLTGDIEKKAELQLINRVGSDIAADLLIAPHHGSKTSSSAAFIATVHPRWVIYPVGYLNRFHFPIRSVQERYQEQGVQELSTADLGSITFTFDKSTNGLFWTSFRQAEPRFWRTSPENDANKINIPKIYENACIVQKTGSFFAA